MPKPFATRSQIVLESDMCVPQEDMIFARNQAALTQMLDQLHMLSIADIKQVDHVLVPMVQNFNWRQSRHITVFGTTVAQVHVMMVHFGVLAQVSSDMAGNHWVIHLADNLTEEAIHALDHCWSNKNEEKLFLSDRSVPLESGQIVEAELSVMLPFTA